MTSGSSTTTHCLDFLQIMKERAFTLGNWSWDTWIGVIMARLKILILLHSLFWKEFSNSTTFLIENEKPQNHSTYSSVTTASYVKSKLDPVNVLILTHQQIAPRKLSIKVTTSFKSTFLCLFWVLLQYSTEDKIRESIFEDCMNSFLEVQ